MHRGSNLGREPELAYLLLEDGSVYSGTRLGADVEATGEVVFNTSMTGYQEVLTDPSYCEQIVVMTVPHVGNYGINAEDPESFLPSPGKITQYHAPGGPGIRVDSHVFNNYVVPPHYDSMIAKVIAHGNNREQAIARMSGALQEMVVDGINTNIPLQRRLLSDAAYRQQPHDIHYLERRYRR